MLVFLHLQFHGEFSKNQRGKLKGGGGDMKMHNFKGGGGRFFYNILSFPN